MVFSAVITPVSRPEHTVRVQKLWSVRLMARYGKLVERCAHEQVPVIQIGVVTAGQRQAVDPIREKNIKEERGRQNSVGARSPPQCPESTEKIHLRQQEWNKA